MVEEGNAESGAVSTRSVSTLVNIFAAPREAFAALAVRPTVLLPILALTLMNAALVGWYYSEVDTVWLLQTMLEDAGQEVPAGLTEAQGTGMAGAGIIGVVSALGAALQILVLLLLAAGYLSLVSLFGNDGVTFKRWLSLAAWSTMPTLLGVLSAIVNVAVNDAAHMRPTDLNMLSFGNLLGVDSAGGGVSAVLLNVDVTAVWALALMTFGYALWTRRSAVVSLAIVAGPLVIVLAGLGLLAGM